jgi:hypothetical protein
MNLRASTDKETPKKKCPRIEPLASNTFLNLKLPISSTHWNEIAWNRGDKVSCIPDLCTRQR